MNYVHALKLVEEAIIHIPVQDHNQTISRYCCSLQIGGVPPSPTFVFALAKTI